MSVQIAVLEDVRYHNELRLARSREWIGIFYFLIALGVVLFSSVMAVLHAYILPLECLKTTLRFFKSVKFCTVIYTILLSGIVFTCSLTGGVHGFIISLSILAGESLILLIVAVVLRIRHTMGEAARAENLQEKERTYGAPGEEPGDAPDEFEQMPLEGGEENPTTDFNDFQAFGEEKDTDAPVESSVPKDETAALDTQEPEEENRGLVGFADEPGTRQNRRQNKSVVFAQDTTLMSEPSGHVRAVHHVPGHKDSIGRLLMKRPIREEGEWTMVPERLSLGQCKTLFACVLLIAIFICSIFVCMAIWDVKTYKLVDGETGDELDEYQPKITAQSLQFMYAFPGVATEWKMEYYARQLTKYCGSNFKKTLSDSDKEDDLLKNWIQKYDINMSYFVPSDYMEYDTVNDWFIRQIDLKWRPAPSGRDDIASPADGRLLVYETSADLKIWIKGDSYTYTDLLGGLKVDGTERYFENGAFAIVRLAPQDYHRFHAPIDGIVTSITELPGTLFSVSADAVRSENKVFLNQRKIVILDAGERFGKVAFIAIGATCVGSVYLGDSNGDLQVGRALARGDEMGNFQFGGSTVVMLFSQGRAHFDDLIVFRSRFPVESYFPMNAAIGRLRA